MEELKRDFLNQNRK